MRLIDADVLKEKIDSMWNGRPLSSLGARILVTIDDAPSIDIVRCRECKHWSGCKSTMHNNHLCGRAENVDYWTRADDFCSYGEREGE